MRMSMGIVPDARGEFNYAPCLNFNADNGHVKLNADNVDNENGNYGSGFFRQFARKTKPSLEEGFVAEC